MTAPRSVDPSLRFGECGERWGNLAAPAGEFRVGDLFVFRGDEELRAVTRVLAFPPDAAKRLVTYESARS